MGAYRLGVLRGDGIGPEIVDAALRVLDAVRARTPGLTLDLRPLPMGFEAIHALGTALPASTVEALTACDGWLMGPHDSAAYPAVERERRNPSGELRHRFDLFANIRPARAYAGLAARVPGLDLVVVRENTEGLYADRNMAAGSGEFAPSPDLVLTVGKFSRAAATRIAASAFALARRRRRRLAVVHKANVLRLAYGLFLDACRTVGRDFPDVAVEEYHVDAMAAHLVRRGADFDVIVTTNLFGDILSDLTGELAGSLGLAPSLNAGARHAMAQPAHGSAPDIAGHGVANPVGMILSTGMLLAWLGVVHDDPAAAAAAQAVERAVAATLAGGVRTPDLGGTASTAGMAAAVVERLLP